MKPIALYIIVGFLGSGKTTFLKNFLQNFSEKSIAVVMNDFGKENVDAKLIKDKISNLKEISDGSLFCSCKSDQFVSTITELSKKEMEIIVVESSGMANPNTLLNLLDLIEEKAHRPIDFKGTIGLIDVARIDKLIQVANMVSQQIACSDLLLLNKIDLITDNKRSIISDLISHYNPLAKRLLVKNGQVSKEAIETLTRVRDKIIPQNRMDLNTQKLMISLAGVDDLPNFEAFIRTLEKEVHRLKGFIYKGEQCYYVECVNGKLHYAAHNDHDQAPYLVILSVMKRNLEKTVREVWITYFQKAIDIL